MANPECYTAQHRISRSGDRVDNPAARPSLFILKDLHPFIEAPATTRWLRDAISSFKGTQKTIILMSPMQQVPIELEKEVVV